MATMFEAGRALVIGIGPGYPGFPGASALPKSVRADAESVARTLMDPALCGYPSGNVQLLLDDQATLANIVAGLEKLAQEAKPSDTVFVFFSGHGGQRVGSSGMESFLVPVDYDGDDSLATSLGAEDLSRLLKTIPSSRVTLVLDACHAEGAAFVKDGESAKRVFGRVRDDDLERLSQGVGRVVFASCTESEVSMTSSHGVSLFTYYLLQGMGGATPDRGDGLVRVFDLFEYLSNQVPANPVAGNVQHPVMKAHMQDNFPVALRKGGLLKSLGSQGGSTAGSVSPRNFDQRQVETVLSQLYPTGPWHSEIWSRAGGDLSTLPTAGNGRAAWHAALRTLAFGGGGKDISLRSLIQAAVNEYPNHPGLAALL